MTYKDRRGKVNIGTRLSTKDELRLYLQNSEIINAECRGTSSFSWSCNLPSIIKIIKIIFTVEDQI